MSQALGATATLALLMGGCAEAPSGTTATATMALKSDGCGVQTLGQVGQCRTAESWQAIAHATCGDLNLTKFQGTRACDGGFTFVDISCCAEAPPVAEPGDEGAQCVTEVVTGCKPASEWQKQAEAACGGELVDPHIAVACGKNRFAQLTFTCCAQTAEITPVEPAPDEAPKPMTCASAALAEGGACLTGRQWKNKALSACKGGGQELVWFETEASCPGGGFAGATLDCCSEMVPEPIVDIEPAAACEPFDMGWGDSCFQDDALEAQLGDMCAAKGQFLGKLQPTGDCPEGSYSGLQGACCSDLEDAIADVSSAPSQPEPKCLGFVLYDDACDETAAFESAADVLCQGQGMLSKSLDYDKPCAGGGFKWALAECCTAGADGS